MELIDFQKGKIIVHRELMSYKNIGHQLHILRQTIESFLTYYDSWHSIDNLLRLGAPQKLSKSDMQYIVHTMELNIRILLAELYSKTDCNVSEWTLRQLL